MFGPLYRQEARYYSRLRHFVPAVLAVALLEFGFQALDMAALGSMGLSGRAGRMLAMIVSPLAWATAWISWQSILREYRTKRAEELRLSHLTSKELFGTKYWTLAIFLLVVVSLSITISWSLYGHFLSPSAGGSSPIFSNAISWLWFSGYYPVLLGLASPVVVWSVMIGFPRSARRWNGFLLAGLLLQMTVHGSFYCGLMALILLKSRYNLFPEKFLGSPLLDVQALIIAIPLPFLALIGWLVRKRFSRLFDLPPV